MSSSLSFHSTTLKTRSIDKEILPLWTGPAWRATVHSCFDGALNLLNQEGTLLIILPAAKCNGPHRILVEVPPLFSFRSYDLKEGDLFVKDKRLLRCHSSTLGIRTDSPLVWSERRKRPLARAPLPRILDNLQESLRYLLENSRGEDALLIEACIQALSANCGDPSHSGSTLCMKLCTLCIEMIRGIRRKDRDFIKKAMQKLIGLGKGLTPSGDDITAGFMSALHFLVSHSRTASPLEYPWNEQDSTELLKWFRSFMEEERTTFFSQKFLQWTSRGRISEEALRLCRGITGRQKMRLHECAAHFLSMGHSSGRELMLGIIIGLSTLALPYPDRSCSS